MEETEESNANKKCTPKRSFRGRTNPHDHQLLQYSNPFRFSNQNQYQSYPALLPLPPPIPLQLTATPPLPQNQSCRSKTHLHKPSWKQNNPPRATSSDTQVSVLTVLPASEDTQRRASSPLRGENGRKVMGATQALVAARRPDSGGVEGPVISLLANHFLVQFDSLQRIFHYDVEISPNPSKEVARMIKRKLVEENSVELSGALPAFDGRKNLYSPLFRINIKLVSKFDGKELNSYLSKEGDDWIPLPQDYLHALDIVLRESPTEKCLPVGRSLYSSSMGGTKDIGGGAVGLRGFFQSLRPTQQGLALNVDFSVTAFHESIGIIPYLQKRVEFLRDLSQRKTRGLTGEERKEETTENLWFEDRDGKILRLVNYFKDHYGYDIQFRNLPCLQISRSKPCYLPMELCMICEGQKFLGKLSDDQTARILKMGCQRPRERKAIIDGVMRGAVGPTSGSQEREFKLHVSREMTRLNGRVLQPPKLKLERWALISFGGTPDQKSNIPRFIIQLSQRCEQLGILLNKNTIMSPHQCCLYQNLGKSSSQFLANLALKINAKMGGCTVALYNSLPSQIPRLLRPDEPVIFMGADVTHPHPLDDFSPSIAAVVGSMNWPAANKYVSRMRSQTHRQEIIQDLAIRKRHHTRFRPTHYHILWDENHFTSDEVQKLVYSLCYTFVRSAPPKTTPLPKLSENVKKLMFYC
ncbi:unnamed protein product, partial [Vitis vinifera]